MTLSSIRPGDIVRVDVKGRVFYAVVIGVGKELAIAPIDRRITYRTVTARQVTDHWRKAGRRAARADNPVS